MNILVIGSGGFIGKHLCTFLKDKQRYALFYCDINNNGGNEPFLKIDSKEPDFDKIFGQQDFDLCINCSGAASVPLSLSEPLLDYYLNVVNVFRILDAIRKNKPSTKFINLSSAAVYGNPLSLPVSETMLPAPVSPYGVHKLQAEQICNSFSTFFNVPTCSLRIFSAYGPGLQKQLFWDLYQKSKTSESIELFGTGEETRDFIFIDDLIKAIFIVVENAAFEGECINVANGKQWKIKDVVNHFYTHLGWKGEVKFKGTTRTGDPDFWEADINLLASIGFKPEFDIPAGLDQYVKWVKSLG